jgi:ATP-dependent RNA helicase RhlB
MNFTDLNLHPELRRGLSEAGYITCMPVQEQVLEHAFSGQDLYVQSQTGTGKTAAFLVVIFQRLLSEAMLQGKKAIIMVPTRELAVQVEEEAKTIGKYLSFKIGSFYGGVGYAQQTAMLRDNVQILVGTPGRVLDLNQSGQMNLMEIAFLVLDEADRMFDMGFYPDLRKLIRAVPPADRRQTMLFSATLNAGVKNLAWEYTKNPFEIAIEPETVTVEEVEQILYHVSSTEKMKLLLGILARENPESAIIFCNTKRYAEILAKRLRMNGYECEFIMGDLPQHKRLKIINQIKAGELRLLVATDVAARGLDIEGLALVVNYDLPNEAENYVHRIGRTARAGKSGLAITLVSEQDVYELPAIERYVGCKLPFETATAELLAEDKSEGRQVRTDHYEEREPGARRDSGGRKGREPRRESGGRDSGGRKGREREKRPREKRHGAERHGIERQREDRGAGPDPKLSELSMDERMAYYKQKYDKTAQGKSAQAPRQAASQTARKDRGEKAGSPRHEGPKAGGRKRGDKRRGRGSAEARAAKAAKAAPGQAVPEQTGPAAEKKKGMLSRFLGIFGDKKENS